MSIERKSIFDRLRAIYAEADRAVAAAGPRCEASGRCCRFKEYGHVLFLSQLEAELLLAEAPPPTGPVTDEGCPWQIDGLCTAREPRPLGCRVYFCDPNYQDTCSTIMEAGLQQIKHLADETDSGWRYAPLHVFLGEASLAPSGSPRLSLPIVEPRNAECGVRN